MPAFDKKVIDLIANIDSITDRILAQLNNGDSTVDQIGELYKDRKKMLANIDDFIAEDSNKRLISENSDEWVSLMEPIRKKDEAALKLLEDRVNEMKKDLKNKESQKKVLKYEENKL